MSRIARPVGIALALLAATAAPFLASADVNSVMRTDDRYQCVRVPDGVVVATSARQDIVQAACAVAVEHTRKPHDLRQPTLHLTYVAPTPVQPGMASSSAPSAATTAPEATSTTLPTLSAATGSASLSWTPPTANTDGSALTDLAGYTVHYGAAADALTVSVRIADPTVRAVSIDNLTAGLWCFSIRAVNAAGTQSAKSNVACKTI